MVFEKLGGLVVNIELKNRQKNALDRVKAAGIYTYLIKLCQEFIGICTLEEVGEIGGVMEHVLREVSLVVAHCLLFPGIDQLLERADLLGRIGLVIAVYSGDVLEDVLRVEHALIDGLGLEAHAHHENLS